MKRLFRGLIALVLVLAMLVSSASALSVEQALEILEINYLRKLPDEVYEAETLDELFALLGDPYTYYMDRETYQGFLDSVEGTVNLVGIGVSIQYTKDGILVLEALKGSPALAAGLRAGDLIVAVNGVGCAPADESHRDLILGEEGTQVTVTVLRAGVLMNCTMKRAAVVVPNTETEVVDGRIGYISCTSFGSDTGELFLEGVETCGESVDCWLIDMRGNSGGITDAAVDAMGVFLGAGHHVYLQDSWGYLYYYEYEKDPATELPTVILTDGGTASAAEAFTAGMRNRHAALIVGSRTYGKGTAQIVLDHETDPELFEGDALKVTAYRFYSGAGVTNDRVGVIPTLLVSDETAYEVAKAACGNDDGEYDHRLVLLVDGWSVVFDYPAMSDAALSALLEAIPPSASLYALEEGEMTELTPETAAEKLGVEYESRWFSDVHNSVFAREINSLATYDVIHGDGEGNFRPTEVLTRGEACALLGKALGLRGSVVRRFDDVAEDDTCAPYISAMAELGLVLGFGDGTFRPNAPVTRQEYCVMLARIARYLNIYAGDSEEKQIEEEIQMMRELGFRPWAYDSVVLLASLKALNVSGGKLEPDVPVLREEAAANLYSVLVETGVLPG